MPTIKNFLDYTGLTELIRSIGSAISSIWTAINGKANISDVQNLCPIIEDTRSSQVATITGVAPFSSLTTGQMILLHLAYSTSNSTKLKLTLSDGTVTDEIAVKYPNLQAYTVISQVGGLNATAGMYLNLIYNGSYWLSVGFGDGNTQYATITDALISTGTDTNAKTVSAKVLRDNFYTESEVNTALSGKKDNDLVVTVTEDNNTLTADKTFDEIYTAYNAGKDVLVIYDSFTYRPVTVLSTSIEFSTKSNDGGDLFLGSLTVNYQDTWFDYGAYAQSELVSGTSIKTVNQNSLLGSGNVTLEGSNLLYHGGENNVLIDGDTIDECLDSLDLAIENKVSISSITCVESSTSGANNVVTVTLSNGTTTTFNVKNGVDGADGVSLGEISLVQTTGTATDAVMSQDAVTKLVGDSRTLTQVLYNGNFASTDSWTNSQYCSVSASDNVITLTPNNTSNVANLRQTSQNFVANHKYFFCVTVKSDIATTFNISASGSSRRFNILSADEWQTCYGIIVFSADATQIYCYTNNKKVTGTDTKFYAKQFMMFDLTDSFGAGKEPDEETVYRWLDGEYCTSKTVDMRDKLNGDIPRRALVIDLDMEYPSETPYNLTTASWQVPYGRRRKGLQVKYKDSNGSPVTLTYLSNDVSETAWNSGLYWKIDTGETSCGFKAGNYDISKGNIKLPKGTTNVDGGGNWYIEIFTTLKATSYSAAPILTLTRATGTGADVQVLRLNQSNLQMSLNASTYQVAVGISSYKDLPTHFFVKKYGNVFTTYINGAKAGEVTFDVSDVSFGLGALKSLTARSTAELYMCRVGVYYEDTEDQMLEHWNNGDVINYECKETDKLLDFSYGAFHTEYAQDNASGGSYLGSSITIITEPPYKREIISSTSPTARPQFTGQTWINTQSFKFYKALGYSGSGDWMEVGNEERGTSFFFDTHQANYIYSFPLTTLQQSIISNAEILTFRFCYRGSSTRATFFRDLDNTFKITVGASNGTISVNGVTVLGYNNTDGTVLSLVIDRIKGVVKVYKETVLLNTVTNNAFVMNSFPVSPYYYFVPYDFKSIFSFSVFDCDIFEGDVCTSYNRDAQGYTMLPVKMNTLDKYQDWQTASVYNGTHPAWTKTTGNDGTHFTISASSTATDKKLAFTMRPTYNSTGITKYFVTDYYFTVVSGAVSARETNASYSQRLYNATTGALISDMSSISQGSYILRTWGSGEVYSNGYAVLDWVSGDAEVVLTQFKYKPVVCVVDIKGDVISGNKVYDTASGEMKKFYYQSNATSSKTRRTLVIQNIPLRYIVYNNSSYAQAFMGQIKIYDNKIYMADTSYTWKQISNT